MGVALGNMIEPFVNKEFHMASLFLRHFNFPLNFEWFKAILFMYVRNNANLHFIVPVVFV